MAYLPSDHDRPLGTCSKVDPLKLVLINKINTFNIIYHKSVNNWSNGIEIHSCLPI